MTSMASPLPAPKSAYLTLWLLAAAFFLPFIVGTGLFWSGWRPGKFVNHGELLQPARLLPESGLRHVDGRPFPTSALRGKWLLVLPVTRSCDDRCIQKLQLMHNVHVALNKEQSRLQRVFISNGASAPAGLQSRFPELVLGFIPAGDEGEEWRRALDEQDQVLYIVDPLGNVMMRYPDQRDLRGVLKDLERLLRYSWIR